MRFTLEEMQMLCVFHEGTVSATLDALRVAAKIPNANKKAVAESLVRKLSELKPGDTVALDFEPEN